MTDKIEMEGTLIDRWQPDGLYGKAIPITVDHNGLFHGYVRPVGRLPEEGEQQ